MAEITLQVFNKTPYWHVLKYNQNESQGINQSTKETTTKLTQNTIIYLYQILCKQTLNKEKKKAQQCSQAVNYLPVPKGDIWVITSRAALL